MDPCKVLTNSLHVWTTPTRLSAVYQWLTELLFFSFFLPFQVVIIIDQTDILFCWRKSKNSHWDQRLSGWSDIIRFRFTSVSSVFQTKRRSSGRCPWLPCDRQTDLYEIGRLSILLREATGITVGGVTTFVLVFHTTSGNTVRLFIITVCNRDRLSSISAAELQLHLSGHESPSNPGTKEPPSVPPSPVRPSGTFRDLLWLTDLPHYSISHLWWNAI